MVWFINPVNLAAKCSMELRVGGLTKNIYYIHRVNQCQFSWLRHRANTVETRNPASYDDDNHDIPSELYLSIMKQTC